MKESSGLHKKFTLEDSAGPQSQLTNSHEAGRRAVAQATANQKKRNINNYGTEKRGHFDTNTGKRRNNSEKPLANTLHASPDGEWREEDDYDRRQYDEKGNQISDTARYNPNFITAKKEYDKLPDNIFKTSDNSPRTENKPSNAGSADNQTERGLLEGVDNNDRTPIKWGPGFRKKDSGGMAKAPSFGFEAFLDNQLGMSGGRTLSGFDKVSGGVYKHGPAKGMTRGQYYEKARAQYAALSDDEKKNWESRAKMKDVRSTRDQAAQQQYEDKLGFNSNQGREAEEEKAEKKATEQGSKGDETPEMASILKKPKDQIKTNLNKSATDRPSIEYLT